MKLNIFVPCKCLLPQIKSQSFFTKIVLLNFLKTLLSFIFKLFFMVWLFYVELYFSITNLKYWGKNEKLLSTTLALLNDLTVGFANVRRLLKTEEIQLLLRNHTVGLLDVFFVKCFNPEVETNLIFLCSGV